jgi:hypothetical protein
VKRAEPWLILSIVGTALAVAASAASQARVSAARTDLGAEMGADARTAQSDARSADGAPSARQGTPPDKKPDAQAVARTLEESFKKQGIHLDLEKHLCWIPVTIDVRDDLLEYLLVNPKGAAHESMFTTNVVPSLLQTALLALGVERGKNALWKARVPAPTAEEMRAGVQLYTVEPPEGDGFYLYAAWRAQGETYFYRVEDLLRDLETGRSMRRHRWVYLGSRWARTRKETSEESFMADLEGNLVNIAFFEQGNTLLTAALPECLKQTIWLTNAWLLPERGTDVVLIFARERLAALPPEIETQLPEVAEAAQTEPRDGR